MAKEKTEYLAPVHPGEVLRFDFMEPMEISQNRLAREIRVPPRRINEIIHGKRGITADTAMRLALFFGTSAQLWLGLQAEYELDCIKRADGGTLRKIIKKFTPSAKVGAML
ncbi:MAG: putative HTH-type transcriptional regulator YbaQ [Lentisphaerae bacterium ADurb.Bin242]|nr:MAG: putative HTH-type transcriptional regulator YbaQ [Lentisphaerae bacterium ADurb.Bin242]